MDLQKLRRKREARNDTSADVKLRQEVTPFSVFLYQHVVCGAEDARMPPPEHAGGSFFSVSKKLCRSPPFRSLHVQRHALQTDSSTINFPRPTTPYIISRGKKKKGNTNQDVRSDRSPDESL
jgi:hypothetical protein